MSSLATEGSNVREPDAVLRRAALPPDALDAMLEGCQVIGFDWRYLYVNDAAAAQARRAKQDLLGRTMMDCYPGIEDTVLFARLRRCMDDRQPHAMDNEFTFPDGASVAFELRIVAVPQGLCVFSLDASHREVRRAQEAVERARDDAEAANRELESFSYSVAHDLRAPLRAIDGFSHALVEDLGPTLAPEQRRHLDMVRDAAQHMAELIDDMLALSRVSRQELRRESVSLTALARDILARLLAQDPARAIHVEVADDMIVWADPKLLRIALENLLGNAWKFTSKRTEARVEVGVEATGAEPTYFVRDDGAGFDMAYGHKLFGVFARLHPASEFDGTGVGLATVQRVVSRHRGRVWAEGAPGRGACFRFTLGQGPWRGTGATYGGEPT